MAGRFERLAALFGRKPPPDPLEVDLVQPELNGGKLAAEQLCAIEAKPEATTLRISGLDQDTFETLVADYGRQFSTIEFWKCPRIADLTPLEGLPGLSSAIFFWNQRTTRLWDFSRTPALVELSLRDFKRLHSLEDLRSATSVRDLTLGAEVWPKSVYETLDPVGSLVRLKRFCLLPKKIVDGRIQPLAALTELESLQIPSNLFSTRQIAWLRARLPDTVKCDVLQPVQTFSGRLSKRTGQDVLVNGKRKPYLNSKADAQRIQRYVDDFWRMVDEFRANPVLEPD